MEGMKDSGIRFIGLIPKEWTIKRIKYVISDIKDGTHGTFDRVEDGFPFLSAKNVFDDGLHITDFESEISEKDYLLITANGFPKKNDVIMCCVGTIGRVCVYDLDESMAFQRSVTFLRPNDNTFSKYLKYCLQSDSTLIQESQLINKSAQDGLYMGAVQELIIPYTESRREQQSIADFLDDKCSQIDGIIADIEKQIEILKSYKKSLITETVTKGLDKNVKMKDSGVEWIGQIPENWDVNEIKYMSILKGRIGWQGLTSDEYQDEGAFLITGVNFNNGGIDWESCEHIPMKRWEEAKDIQIEDGDLLITKDGTIGKVAVVSGKPGETSLNSGVMRIKTHEGYNRKYLYWVLQSDVFWNWFNLKNAGNSTIQHLYQGDFAEFKYAYPNPKLQIDIAAYLDKQCLQIDSIITTKQAQLTKMQQHKKSLIYEYVTGKKRVAI